MMTPRGRSLNLADRMILVAATATGISADLDALKYAYHRGMDNISLAEFPTNFFSVVLPTWLTWTFAVLAIRLRRPRPDFRRIIRQPGLAAGLAASICATVLVASQLALSGRRGGLTWPFLPGSFYLGLPGYLAPTVFGAWLTLFLNRRWKGERGPIDCLGLGLGIGWISFYLTQLACEVLR